MEQKSGVSAIRPPQSIRCPLSSPPVYLDVGPDVGTRPPSPGPRHKHAAWSDQVLFRISFLEGRQLELGLGVAVLVDERAELFRLQVRPDESACKARSEGLRTRDPPLP